MPRWDANVGILQGGAHSSDQAEISLENTTPVFAQMFPGCAAAGNMLKCILWDSLCFSHCIQSHHCNRCVCGSTWFHPAVLWRMLSA